MFEQVIADSPTSPLDSKSSTCKKTLYPVYPIKPTDPSSVSFFTDFAAMPPHSIAPAQTARAKCRVCGVLDEHSVLIAKEMMFGTGDSFEYFQCSQCQCLQIRTVPNLDRYYPPNYYSMQATLASPATGLLRAVEKLEVFLRLKVMNWGQTKRKEIFEWLRTAEVSATSPILDIGCGRGAMLHQLYRAGFRNLTGADPFIEAPIEYSNGIRIHKATVDEVSGTFQLVMMHHSFEHMEHPLDILRFARTLLRPNGCLLLRIPLVSSMAFRTYGADWFQLDAPRHLFLHSRRSIEVAASGAGLHIQKVTYDSKASQFWGSEQYRAGIPHRDPQSHGEDPSASVFSTAQIEAWSKLSQELNAREDGDAACFYLRRA